LRGAATGVAELVLYAEHLDYSAEEVVHEHENISLRFHREQAETPMP